MACVTENRINGRQIQNQYDRAVDSNVTNGNHFPVQRHIHPQTVKTDQHYPEGGGKNVSLTDWLNDR